MTTTTENTFALSLLAWHRGSGSGLYAVGSSLNAGKWPPFAEMLRARRELTAERQAECTKLLQTLTLMLETRPEYCAEYQRWKELMKR